MGEANPAYIAAMRLLRRSSAAQRHTDRHAEARKGRGKGGRPRQHEYEKE